MSSSEDQPKYLACARALALLSGLAGSVAACGGTATDSVQEGEPLALTATTDAADAQSATSVYDGGPMGTRVHSSGGCDVGGTPAPASAPLLAGVAGAALIARRRHR